MSDRVRRAGERKGVILVLAAAWVPPSPAEDTRVKGSVQTSGLLAAIIIHSFFFLNSFFTWDIFTEFLSVLGTNRAECQD